VAVTVGAPAMADVDDALPLPLLALREALRRFLVEEVRAAERLHHVGDEGDAPPDLVRWVRTRSRELGLFSALQPAELGGAGLGPLGVAALHEVIGASGAALGRFALGDDGGVLKLGDADQRARFLVPVLRGEIGAAFAFTDAREGPRTTAVRRGDAFLVSGVKAFVTDGPRSDFLLTVARVTENDGGPTGSAVLVIPRAAPGVILRRELRTLDGGVHGEFELREVSVPAADVLGQIGQGLRGALASITTVRLRIAAVACGTGRWVLDDTLAQVDRPHRSGVPLGEREHVQAMIADSAIDLYAARAAVYTAARRAESGADAEVEVAMAKALATEAVARIVDRAIQLTGGAAVVEGHPLARLYRRIRAWRIGEGTTEVLRLTIARGLLARRAGC
jgi:alkylation response protein AidB-like acyl-CoA dehydrogenase